MNEKQIQLARQGDFLVALLPEGMNVPGVGAPVAREVVSESRLTGHKHQFRNGKTKQYALAGSTDRLVELPSNTALIHEEHGEIPVPKGRAIVRRQVERSSEGIAEVQD